MPVVSKSKYITLILRVQKSNLKRTNTMFYLQHEVHLLRGGSLVLKILLGNGLCYNFVFINRWGCLEYGDIRPCNKCKIVKKYDNFDMWNQVKENISIIILMLKFWKSTWIALRLKHPQKSTKVILRYVCMFKANFYTKTWMAPTSKAYCYFAFSRSNSEGFSS